LISADTLKFLFTGIFPPKKITPIYSAGVLLIWIDAGRVHRSKVGTIKRIPLYGRKIKMKYGPNELILHYLKYTSVIWRGKGQNRGIFCARIKKHMCSARETKHICAIETTAADTAAKY